MTTRHDHPDLPLSPDFEVIEGQPQPQPRGTLTRFSPQRERDHARVDLGECAIWLLIIFAGIVLAWRTDNPDGGLGRTTCAGATVAQQEIRK